MKFTAIFGAALAAALALAPAAAARDDGPVTQTVQIRASGDGPSSEQIILGLNKAAIVELPADAADVLVSNPEIVDAIVRTPRRIYILGLKTGQTNAFFFSDSGRQILNLEIRVEQDTSALGSILSRHMPDAKIRVETINDNVVLTGSVPNAAAAAQAADIAARFVGNKPENVLNMLTITGGEQVMIRVRVAEMQRTIAKQLGIDLKAAVNSGGVPLVFQGSNPFSLLGRALDANSQAGIGLIDPAKGGRNNVEGSIRALERAGVLRLLAEPNLTAVSGESANFLAGGEFPVPTSIDDKGQVIITFKPFGVGLGFTPVVMSEGRISLRISTEVSELTSEGAFVINPTSVRNADGTTTNTGGISMPGLRVRRAETTVELPSGGSMMLAGLLRDDLKQNIDGYPGLKDMPVLGALFRSRDYQSNQTELVVIVTAYMADPVSGKELALPTDGFVPSTDAEAFALGRTNTPYDGAPAAAGGTGHIIE